MTRHTIPAVLTTTCDHCGTTWETQPLLSAELRMRVTAVGPSGDVGGGESEFDLCGTCLGALRGWLDVNRVRTRSGAK